MSTRILTGDCRALLPQLPDASVHCVVTSPPYWGLRDYGVAGQIGLEASVDAYVTELVAVFREVRRVLRPDGTLWLNMGDCYAGSWSGSSMRPQGGRQRKGGPGFQDLDVGYPDRAGVVPCGLKPKDLVGLPWRVAFALQADGWWLRSDIIWHKPNPMPESITDRPTKAHEYLFLLSTSQRYYYDADAVKEPCSWGDVSGDGPDYAPPGGGPRHTGLRRRGPKVPAGWDTTPGGHGTIHRTGRAENAATFRGGVYTNGQAFDNDRPMTRNSHGNEPNASEVRNRRTVWTIASAPFRGAHFATFPPALVEPCILAGCPPGGTVLDPFGGAGTVGLVADRLDRNSILMEINPEYAEMSRRRVVDDAPLLAEVSLTPAVMFPHRYAWGNNPVRALLKGRRCRIVCTGRLGSALVEFEDGHRVVSSRRAVRRAS